ncbi:endonuclease [Epidermidibacterium keratini]|uniref:Endonuclease n=1 Tax=Epidermidibacterium keratini TaxID=1891644 RepID=A0A7L4YQQ6_9ACTN|nr:endonuclease [Epidermidibacterium keratini]QHC01372.1 endonuclease [Epidermidibacterium keratini]
MADPKTAQDVASDLLDRHKRTFAAEASIRLRDRPKPLYQLLVLTTLSATRISADIAVAAARELFRAGLLTPQRMLASSWQHRVDALGRAHYKRYDESTATKLAESAQYLQDEYSGDLRALRPDSADDVAGVVDALTGFPRIGPTGADIFCREAQQVWPALSPYFDKRALRRAGKLGLPTEPRRLAKLAPDGDVALLAAALARDA